MILSTALGQALSNLVQWRQGLWEERSFLWNSLTIASCACAFIPFHSRNIWTLPLHWAQLSIQGPLGPSISCWLAGGSGVGPMGLGFTIPGRNLESLSVFTVSLMRGNLQRKTIFLLQILGPPFTAIAHLFLFLLTEVMLGEGQWWQDW